MVPDVYTSSLKACHSVMGMSFCNGLGKYIDDDTLHIPKDPLHLGHQQLPALLGLDVLKTDLDDRCWPRP